ncbi:MAG: DUF1304 domain-containing protein [Saprospiraceae bacterium]|nr:DUF1304 domain-containing protein [Saprospiraceae bacterium]
MTVNLLQDFLILLIALLHLYILYMEMFAWESMGKKTFRGAMPEEMFKPTKILAANQGLYNGFLAAGLVWSLIISDPNWSENVAIFFLLCVAVAGIYGGFTASRKIFYVQTVPALLTLCLVLIN